MKSSYKRREVIFEEHGIKKCNTFHVAMYTVCIAILVKVVISDEVAVLFGAVICYD